MATTRVPAVIAPQVQVERHSARGKPSVIRVDNVIDVMPEGGYPLLAGFRPVKKLEFKRLVIAIDGEQKTGKTSLALMFPKPIAFMNLDFSLAELLAQHPELWDDNLCQEAPLQMNEMIDPGTWGVLLEEFHYKYLAALEFAETYAGTVIVDTATQLWQIVQAVMIEHVRSKKIAKIEAKRWISEEKKEEALEKAEKASRLDWGLANAFMGGILRRAMHCTRANVVFVHRVKEIYDENGKPTGTFGFHGYGETPAIVQMTIRTLRVQKPGGGFEHRLRIRDCRFGSQWQGFEMPVPADPYGTLVGLMYPEGDDEEGDPE